MIIEADVTTVVSNMPVGAVTEMSISKEGMAHLMKTLTNLYNDPKMAVIREYFANGLDSHVMAGQTEPVQVSLPTSYNKMFVVQDFGIGMSVDDINNIYSKYGESTKRESNDQIGAYGLGAKSALAIANQFTLVSIKDGIKATVLVQKAESGINTMSVVSVTETQDANGVTVSIPVSEPYEFNNKAREFFRFVDPGLVLVDGYAPSSAYEDVTKLEDITVPGVEVFVDMDRSYGTSYVIMGQVSYALSTSNIEEAAERIGVDSTYELRSMPVYFKVPIGAVDLTPNREGLRFTDKTNAVIDSLIKEYLESVKKEAQEEIDAIDSRFDVYAVAARWDQRLGMKMQWRGEEIITEIKTASPSSTIKRTSWDKSSHGSTYTMNLVASDREQRIIVTGQPFDKYKRVSNYITDYLAMEDLNNGVKFYFRENLDELDNEWVTENPKLRFENFEDMIQRVKDHRKAERAAVRAAMPKELRDRPSKLEYPVLSVDDVEMVRTAYDAIPDGAYYVHASDLLDPSNFKQLFEGSAYGHSRVAEFLKSIVGEGASVVFISKSRSVESFKTRMKEIEVRNLADMASDVQARVDALMTDEVLRLRSMRLLYTANRRLASMDREWIDQILDEGVRTLVAPVSAEAVENNDEAKRLQQAMMAFGFKGVKIDIVEMEEQVEEEDSSAKYPLLDSLTFRPSAKESEHAVRYMNMIYVDELTLVDA